MMMVQMKYINVELLFLIYNYNKINSHIVLCLYLAL